jgi:glycosyltransferase involved in cell wall biosynthesis
MKRLTSKPNIAVITAPFYTTVPKIIIANFLDLLEPSSNDIYVITGFFSYKPNTKIHIISIKKDDIRGSVLRRILRYLLAQPRVAFNLLKISKRIDIVIFFLGTRTYLLPLLIAKLLNKKVVLAVTGMESKGAKIKYGKKFLGLGIVYSAVVRILEKIDFRLADQIIVRSKGTIDFQGLTKYRKKINANGAMYIDTNLFTVKKELKDRRNSVGYIGRLVYGKGISDFIKAMPLILEERKDIKFLIGGNGPLFGEIKSELEDKGLHDKVKLTGWIPHDELTDYLNELKLLVLPSSSEGLPNIMLEAMACGTPVLATPVGGVPDVIKDGETGFILENNSLKCIAENVMRALNHLELDKIMKNARKLIEKEYTYDAAVERYRKILNNL